jgi:hypothetical protein
MVRHQGLYLHAFQRVGDACEGIIIDVVVNNQGFTNKLLEPISNRIESDEKKFDSTNLT